MSDAPGGPPDLAARLAEFDTATLYEAADQRGAMAPGLHSLVPGKRVAGPALTVACPPGDNLMLHAAVAEARRGEILVAQCHDPSFGSWGEVLTVAAMARGIRGLVIDGGVRDLDAIRDLGFPVFARGVALRATRKADLGYLRMPVSCSGLLVWPGDYVVGDDSGIVVISAAAVDGVLRAAHGRRDKEAVMMENLRQGQTSMEMLNLRAVLADLTERRRKAL